MVIELVFIVLFCIEMALKLIAMRHLFWFDGWNVLDFVIIGASGVACANYMSCRPCHAQDGMC